MLALSGRRALVTGGGRGIGRAVALDLGRAGAAVAVAARTRAEVEKVAAEVEGGGGRAVALTIDVADPDSVRAAFAQAREVLGGIDILVSGAGVAPTAPLARTSDAVWRQVLETNLSGVFYGLREALPEMAARGWGRVVNLASTAGKRGYPYIGAYAASKHGVLGLTRCAALEVATTGVTVNAVCPGYVDTPMLEAGVARIVEKTGLTQEEARRRLADMSPQRRLYTAEEVSALVLFLCGEGAGGINGQALSIDGGTVV
ncbi:MAG: 3-hydroxyacyl-CoA dehydrogenase [Acidobacteria bacterium]|nr:MAG: 3-hydroxyacyl-CoA dehydrogenase [Acidobacteriota bacterium]